MLNSLAIASLVFLVLYFILFVVLIVGYATRRLKLKSRWTIILLHVALRLASQGTGLGFGIEGYKATGLLVAYLILGAEGYFTLVLCTARFLVSWHNHNFAAHDSWLEPRKRPGQPRSIPLGLFGLLSPTKVKERPLDAIHWLLIIANVLIITGGSLLSGGSSDASTAWYENDSITTAKILRTVGQSIFFIINVGLFGCIVATVRQARREDSTRPIYAHPTLLLLLMTWPFLAIRGVFGICQAAIDSLNYYNPSIYEADGLSSEFVVKEAVLATMTEWITCLLLILTYPASRHDPHVPPVERLQEGEKDSEVEMERRSSQV